MERIVVVGAGQAGASLVARLRKKGFEGRITLVGEEPVPPYQRPPLSKAYLLGEMAIERLYLRPESFYAEQDIDLVLSGAATAIDREAKTVTVNGAPLPYDALALTTGSMPRRLPAAIGGDLGGVVTVRTLGDVDAMAHRFGAGAKVLIVGGGYIGLEAAAVASKLGLDVTVVEQADRILQPRRRPGDLRLFPRPAHKPRSERTRRNGPHPPQGRGAGRGRSPRGRYRARRRLRHRGGRHRARYTPGRGSRPRNR